MGRWMGGVLASGATAVGLTAVAWMLSFGPIAEDVSGRAAASLTADAQPWAKVAIDGPDVRILAAGDRQIDLLRAGAAAIWGTGRAIFGFRVPEQLYADPFHRP